MSMVRPTHHYIGRCPMCDTPIASVYDMVDRVRDTADAVYDMMRRGLKVERVELGSVDIPPDGCTCQQRPEYGLPLFAEVTL